MDNRGVVKGFRHEKGFGFIARDGQPDLFFHYSQIARGWVDGRGRIRLDNGDRVTFDGIEETAKGLRAVGVRREVVDG